MPKIRKLSIAGIIASAAALVGAAIPAYAGTAPTWHQVYSHHYGPAANDYSGFTSMLSFGENNVWAFGGTDLSGGDGTTPQVYAMQWNGRGWSVNKAPAGLKSYISATGASSASDIWAVTFSGGYVLHWNGAKWSVATQLTGGGLLSGVTVLSPTNVWVFGSSGYGPGDGTWHYNGSSWTHVTGTYDGIGEASAVSASDIWGVAGVTAPDDTIVRFDGHSWKPVAGSPAGLTGYGVTAFAANNVWFIAQAQGVVTSSYLVNYSGHFSKVKVPWGLSAISGMASDGKGGLWFTAVNISTHQVWEVHWFPGNRWQRVAVSFDVDGSTPALIPGTTSLVVGGLTQQTTGGSAVVWAYGSI
jgi:hypothetical protein